MISVLAQAADQGGGIVSTGEAVVFWILGPVALASALAMVFARNAVHSALFLAATMLSLAVLYMIQQAPFLGFVQIIVYTGAVMMLFLFVLMLVGRDSSDSVVEVLRGQRVGALLLGVAFALLLVAGVGRAFSEVTPAGLGEAGSNGNLTGIGRLVFTKYLFSFELTSALLITAAVGAMVLTHTQRPKKRSTQREQAIARFAGTHPTPLSGPGVFAETERDHEPAIVAETWGGDE
jgi:NADH-quinone oxidoreductase subunit J